MSHIHTTKLHRLRFLLCTVRIYSAVSLYVPTRYMFWHTICICPPPPYMYFSPCVVMTSTQLGGGGRCCSGGGWDTTGGGWDTTQTRSLSSSLMCFPTGLATLTLALISLLRMQSSTSASVLSISFSNSSSCMGISFPIYSSFGIPNHDIFFFTLLLLQYNIFGSPITIVFI